MLSSLARGLLHMCLGAATAAALLLFPGPTRTVLLVITPLALVGEIARISLPSLKRFVAVFSIFFRKGEEQRLSGASYFLIGCLVTALAFPKEIAFLAILFLAFGDPAASLIGRWRGHARLWNKSLEGNTACFTACLLVGMAAPVNTSVAVIAGGALAATLFELVPLGVNDNIAIPVGSAGVMMLLGALL